MNRSLYVFPPGYFKVQFKGLRRLGLRIEGVGDPTPEARDPTEPQALNLNWALLPLGNPQP